MSRSYVEEVARARACNGAIEQRLAIIREACREFLPEYNAAVDRFVVGLQTAKAGRDAPKIGELMPDFALLDQSGRLWRLETALADGPVVISFHRGVWCSFCRVTVAALAEAHPRIRAAGGQLAAISPQRAQYGAQHLAEAGAEFPMLSDVGAGLATSLGLNALLTVELITLLDEFGVDLASINGDDGRSVPIPATFVVGADGRVALRHIDSDPRRRQDIGAIVQAAAAAGGGI